MPEPLKHDTIIALSSGHGRAGVSVFRISGPNADAFLKAYCRGELPAPRQSSLRWIYTEEGDRVDQALILRFCAPASFSGEDLVELHTHGSPALAEEILRLALRLDQYRLAEPGEFSRRAFENGKLDLIQAEGIADVIDAVTTTQLKQAVRFVAGDASEKLTGWRSEILKASAFLAASIDFSDEGDVGENPHAPVLGIIDSLIAEFDGALNDARQASRVRDGIRIAILGEPNVGKSTLMNALAKRDAAIVSDIAGTTRDILEVHLVIGGVPVTMADTAGLRDTDDPIEAEGVRRARAWAETADLKLYLSVTGEQGNAPSEPVDLWIGTKVDQSGNDVSKFDMNVSAKTGQGLSELRARLSDEVRRLTGSDEPPSLVRARHQSQISEAIDALHKARQQLSDFDDVDLAAFELSIARSALDRIVGRVDVEDILGEVFSGFCVGK